MATAMYTISFNAMADEGMWLPSLISQRIGDMQAKGFRLTAEDIYSINQASLKDAVVLFGSGCTGELISPEGLLITNHHCGYGQIQRHSSVEHDYLRDGFWAMSREEELPNEGLEVRFLDRMEDVTDIVLKGYEDGMSEEQRDSLIKANSVELIDRASAGGKGLEADVEALYYGNQYFLFVYRVFSDVRLVGAPPSSIGKFGGDTDNWMWPRHTGDFSIFRIYADKDNCPAGYSEDNVPYRPKKYFSISTGGVSEGDFTMVYGFPGRTMEYITSGAVRYISEISDPHKIALRSLRLDIQDRYMSQSQAVRIQYASKNASVANAWKKWQGEMRGIRKMNTVAVKRAYEERFKEWAEGTPYEGILEKLDSLYCLLEPYAFAADYYMETARTVELSRFATEYAGLQARSMLTSSTDKAEELRKNMKKLAAAFYKDYYLPIDRESFAAVMEMFDRNMPEDFKPDYFRNMLARYGSTEVWADSLFGNSLFADSTRLHLAPWNVTTAGNGTADNNTMGNETVGNGTAGNDTNNGTIGNNDPTGNGTSGNDTAGIILPSGDPAVEFGREFKDWYDACIKPVTTRLNREINLLYRDYMKGQMEFAASVKDGITDSDRTPESDGALDSVRTPGSDGTLGSDCTPKSDSTSVSDGTPDSSERASVTAGFYPDANLTLRIAYGTVQGYSPADGTWYLPVSTMEGIIQKDNPEIFDYNIPQKLRDIHAAKDYGRWAVTDAAGNTTVPVCFIATNHTSGGNSGSPVINADGNLIGINFDRVWEGTMSDIVFDPDLCRNISLDIRYVLFIIDKVAGAGHLLDEMTLIE